MWLLSGFGAADGLRPPWDRLLDSATICVTVWALLRWHEKRNGGKGERLVSDAEFHAVEAAIARGVAEARRGETRGRQAYPRSAA